MWDRDRILNERRSAAQEATKSRTMLHKYEGIVDFCDALLSEKDELAAEAKKAAEKTASETVAGT